MKIEKLVKDSLSFLENKYIRNGLVGLLLLYVAGVLPMLTPEVSAVFAHPLAKLFFMLLVLYLSTKDLPLALLLALTFVLSVMKDHRNYAEMMSMMDDEEEEKETFVGMGHGKIEGGNLDEYSDCVKECRAGGILNTFECKGVNELPGKELNTQGLNCPVLGFSGEKQGSPF